MGLTPEEAVKAVMWILIRSNDPLCLVPGASFVSRPRRLPLAVSPVKVSTLMRTVTALTMCRSDKLLHNDALANLVTSFINVGGVSYMRLM